MSFSKDEVINQIHSALATVSDPELHRPLPDLGMVESVDFDKWHKAYEYEGVIINDNLSLIDVYDNYTVISTLQSFPKMKPS